MKRTVLFIVLAFAFNLYSQSYYYYEGKKTELIPRTDRIVVVVNEGINSRSDIESYLKSSVDNKDSIGFIAENIYSIKFLTPSGQSKRNSLIADLEKNNSIVKFASEVYYGTSRSVTSIVFDRFVVKLFDVKNKEAFDELNKKYGCIVVRNVEDEKGYLVKTGNGVKYTALEIANLYYETGLFEYAEPDFGYPDGCIFNYSPNDPYFASQWAIKNTSQSLATDGSSTYGDLTTSAGIVDADMDVSEAWDIVTGNSSVLVGVFDTGIDSTHPDLSPNLLAGYDAYANTSSVKTDPGSHGTCTAGLIGAVTNNGVGVSGIAGGNGTLNSGCKIMSFKLVDASGNFTTNTNIARAFDTARGRNIHISSNSWGGGSAATVLTNAINNLANLSRGGSGCVILFSTGNDGRSSLSYPSYLASVIGVNASTRHDQGKSPATGNQFWWGGNYGSDANGDIDICAPTICYTTDIQGSGGYNTTGDYDFTFNGTSAACPNAAGVTALIFSVNPAFTSAQVKDYLIRGCEKIENLNYATSKTYGGWNPYTGYGRVNAFNSVKLAQGLDVTAPTIVHDNVASNRSTLPVTINAIIYDQDGSTVESSGNLRPRIFYRISKNNGAWSSFDSLYYESKNSNTYTFRLPGQGFNTRVQYYIKANDAAGNLAVFPLHASTSYLSTLCFYAVGNIVSETNKIPSFTAADGGASNSSSVAFVNSYPVIDINVTVNLRHTYISDITFNLNSPYSDKSYNRSALFSCNGGSGDNMTNTVIKDSAVNFFNAGTPPYTGSFKPEYSLRMLNGITAAGNWNLTTYDGYSGDQGTFDSVRITIREIDGTLSSCARRDNLRDSVLSFGTVSNGTTDRNFYLKNNGTSNLNIGTPAFSGTYASMFSLVNSPATVIVPGDSALITVRVTYGMAKNIKMLKLTAVEGAVMTISTNDPSKNGFTVSLQSENTLPVELQSFTAKNVKGNVLLNWTTSTETNNYGFEVQRMNEVWEKLSFIPGAGNSNSKKEYSFIDVLPGNCVNRYRLKQIDIDGTERYTEELKLDLNIPDNFELEQNYPNPFNPATTIRYSVPETGLNGVLVMLKVFNILGDEVAVLVNENKQPGRYEVTFDGKGFASGLYFYKIKAGSYESAKKMLLIK